MPYTHPVATEEGIAERIADIEQQNGVDFQLAEAVSMIAERLEAHDVLGEDAGDVVDYAYLKIAHHMLSKVHSSFADGKYVDLIDCDPLDDGDQGITMPGIF